MEYRIACLMCEGTGEDYTIPEAGCLGCLGEGYIVVSKAEHEEYHKYLKRKGENLEDNHKG